MFHAEFGWYVFNEAWGHKFNAVEKKKYQITIHSQKKGLKNM